MSAPAPVAVVVVTAAGVIVIRTRRCGSKPADPSAAYGPGTIAFPHPTGNVAGAGGQPTN
jgi:hypothetical protein